MNGEHIEDVKTEQFSAENKVKVSTSDGQTHALKKGDCTYRLEELAFTRSGDKGDTANIGMLMVF